MALFNDSIDFNGLLNETLLSTTEEVTPSNPNGYGHLSTFLRVVLALLFRGGYVFVQIGTIPIENVYLILLQNVVDLAVSTTAFGLIGHTLAFGDDTFFGVVSYKGWLTTSGVDFDVICFGFAANLIGTAIITALLGGRLHFLGYLLCSLLFSAAVQPIVMHWIWHPKGWLHETVFLNYDMCLKDHAGSLTVHAVSSTVGLVGALFLGRRLVRLNDIDESSLGSESPGTTVVGYVLIAIGLIGFSIPAHNYEITHYPQDYIGSIVVNDLMAMSGGVLASIALNFAFSRKTFNYWIVLQCVQGSIAGLVTVAAGVDVYNAYVAFGIGTFGGVVFYAFACVINYTSIEDYSNVIAIHFACAFFGTLLPSFLGSSENLGLAVSAHFKFLHFIWQLFGAMAAILMVSLISVSLFGLLLLTGFLRNSSERNNHLRSVNAAKIERSCCLQRLFVSNDSTALVEPGAGGKLPDIPLSSRKSQDFRRTKERKPKGDGEEVRTASDRHVSYADSVDERNTKLIYALHEIIHDLPPPIPAGLANCHGDCCAAINRRTDARDDEKQSQNASVKLRKNPSYYVLHRTKKCVHLYRGKRNVTVSRWNKSNERTKSRGRSRKLIEYDKQFDDDITTLKMPKLNGRRNSRSRRIKNSC